MKRKLCLTIDESIVNTAKKYVLERGRSLSDLIENYLKALTNEEDMKNEELTPVVKSLKGSFKLPANFNYKKELSKRQI